MDTCFVLMPFKEPFTSYYNDILKETIEGCGLAALRADEKFGPRPIMEDVIDCISTSKLLIAELTTQNPNVNYELGLAHALGKPVILVAQNISEIPFDYRNIRVVLYDTTDSKWQMKLSRHIELSIKEILTNPEKYSIQKFLLSKQLSILNESNIEALIFLKDLWRQFEGEIEYDYKYDFDETGACNFNEIWTIKTISHLSHIYTTIFSKKPGKIRVKHIKNLMTESYQKIINEVQNINETCLPFFVIMENLIYPDTEFKLELNGFAENLLPGLFESKKDSEIITNDYLSKVKHFERSIRYSFPNIDSFNELSATLKIKKRGKVVETILLSRSQTKTKIIFEFDFTTLSDKIEEFEIVFER